MILITLISIFILSFTIVTPINTKSTKENRHYILVSVNQNNLDEVQMIEIPQEAIVTSVQILDWNYEVEEELKPSVRFYPTYYENPDLSFSNIIHEQPYDYEILKKGKKKYMRLFVPSESYSDDYHKITTTELTAKIYYETKTSYSILDYNPQNPDYEYVIVTNESFWPIFNQDFKSWKQTSDDKINNILIVNVSDITGWGNFTVNSTYGDGTNTSGGNHWIPDGKEVTSSFSLFNDTQAQIRNFLRHCYDTYNTRYVLLGGNKNVVPPRLVCSYAVGSCGSCTDWDNDTSHASDMYYECLDYNMNNNTNSYWMENECCGTTWDEIDWGYDLYVGRVLVGTTEKLYNWINKTKEYIDGNANDKGNYLDNFIVACKNSGNSISNQTWTGWTGSYFGPDIGDEFSTNQSIVNNQNITQAQWSVMNEYVNGSQSGYDGIHLIYHTGHGGTLYSSDGGCFRPYQVNNTDTPTFVYTEGCNSGDFGTDVDSRTERWMEYPECSQGIISNSAFGWFVASTYYGELFLQELFNSTLGNYTTTFSEANQKAKERYGHAADCVWGMIVKETNYFGDPALDYQWYSPTSNDSSNISFIDINGGGNQTIIDNPTPIFNWTAVGNTSQYWLQVATNSSFTTLVVNISNVCEAFYPSEFQVINGNISFTLPTSDSLTIFTKYYCRVKAYAKTVR